MSFPSLVHASVIPFFPLNKIKTASSFLFFHTFIYFVLSSPSVVSLILLSQPSYMFALTSLLSVTSLWQNTVWVPPKPSIAVCYSTLQLVLTCKANKPCAFIAKSHEGHCHHNVVSLLSVPSLERKHEEVTSLGLESMHVAAKLTSLLQLCLQEKRIFSLTISSTARH
jgi:hypothetical protein